MKRSRILTALSCLFLTGIFATAAEAGVDVYVLNSGNSTADTALVNLLTSFGHTVTLGVEFTAFDGTQNLTGIDTVYFQCNYNWAIGDMPTAGQSTLVNFVNRGGGLVTTEWFLWNTAAGGQFSTLAPLSPVVPTGAFDSAGTGTFRQTTPEATLNAGLPTTFTTVLTSLGGTETHFDTLRPGAVSYYENNGFIGLAGTTFGTGRVLSFNTLNTQEQVADPNFGRLLSNSLEWAGANAGAVAAPEPGTSGLLILGLVSLFRVRRRHRA